MIAALDDCPGRCQAHGLTRQAAFAAEFVRPKIATTASLPWLGNDSQFYLAIQKIIYRVSSIARTEHRLIFLVI